MQLCQIVSSLSPLSASSVLLNDFIAICTARSHRYPHLRAFPATILLLAHQARELVRLVPVGMAPEPILVPRRGVDPERRPRHPNPVLPVGQQNSGGRAAASPRAVATVRSRGRRGHDRRPRVVLANQPVTAASGRGRAYGVHPRPVLPFRPREHSSSHHQGHPTQTDLLVHKPKSPNSARIHH